MDLTKTKKELIDLVNLIKSNREDLKKQIETDTKYFNSILEQVKAIKSFEEDMNLLNVSMGTDINNFKITYKEIEKITLEQDLKLSKIYESVKDMNVNNDIFLSFKNKLLKDKHFKNNIFLSFNNNNVKGIKTTDLIFRGLIVVSLIFSTINLFKGGSTEQEQRQQTRKHIEPTESPYCLDNYDNNGEYTPFTQHEHSKEECRE